MQTRLWTKFPLPEVASYSSVMSPSWPLLVLETTELLSDSVDYFALSRVQCRRRQWHPTPVLLPGKSHGWRSLVGCSPWGREESDMTEWLHFHLSLSCIGEGNGNPLQCSCLENPRDRGAWWAAVYGVAQSWTWLKWLSRLAEFKVKGVTCISLSMIYFTHLPLYIIWRLSTWNILLITY